jgi:hypothetical protein
VPGLVSCWARTDPLVQKRVMLWTARTRRNQ